jgi:hypothetical protein
LATITKVQVFALKPLRARVACAFCGDLTWWEKRPELVFRGSHRYPRWCCSECGRTAERCAEYARHLSVTRLALKRGPGTPEWLAYTKIDSYTPAN